MSLTNENLGRAVINKWLYFTYLFFPLTIYENISLVYFYYNCPILTEYVIWVMSSNNLLKVQFFQKKLLGQSAKGFSKETPIFFKYKKT